MMKRYYFIFLVLTLPFYLQAEEFSPNELECLKAVSKKSHHFQSLYPDKPIITFLDEYSDEAVIISQNKVLSPVKLDSIELPSDNTCSTTQGPFTELGIQEFKAVNIATESGPFTLSYLSYNYNEARKKNAYSELRPYLSFSKIPINGGYFQITPPCKKTITPTQGVQKNKQRVISKIKSSLKKLSLFNTAQNAKSLLEAGLLPDHEKDKKNEQDILEVFKTCSKVPGEIANTAAVRYFEFIENNSEPKGWKSFFRSKKRSRNLARHFPWMLDDPQIDQISNQVNTTER